MDSGILIINKPKGITSHDVVAKIRKILQIKKVGHTGTLDPMATGVLVVCVGMATKLVQYLTCDEKIYEVQMKLGIKTDTGDITGNIIETSKINYANVDNDFWKAFIGKQKQIPPMYSAIKKDGVKLYELARKGIEVEREPRDIEIFDIYNIEIQDDIIKYTVHCSKGTYVRVLCEDIAKKLNTVGTMIALNRIETGKFKIENAIELEDVSKEKIIPLNKIIDNRIQLKNDIEKLVNGVELDYNEPDGLYSLYTNHFIGIGKITNKKLKREIIL